MNDTKRNQSNGNHEQNKRRLSKIKRDLDEEIHRAT